VKQAWFNIGVMSTNPNKKRVCVETDAPYLAPDPKRGKRNEPAFVKFTAQRLAEVHDLSLDVVEQKTDVNAIQLFQVQ